MLGLKRNASSHSVMYFLNVNGSEVLDEKDILDLSTRHKLRAAAGANRFSTDQSRLLSRVNIDALSARPAPSMLPMAGALDAKVVGYQRLYRGSIGLTADRPSEQLSMTKRRDRSRVASHTIEKLSNTQSRFRNRESARRFPGVPPKRDNIQD